jgi:hypothetical protein
MRRVKALEVALKRSPAAPGDLDARLFAIKQSLHKLDLTFNGYRSKGQVGEKNRPSIRSRMRIAAGGVRQSTYGPTPTILRTLEIAEIQFKDFKSRLETIRDEALPALEKALIEAGAPWVEGQPIPEE